jgi:hypothetical protein
MPEEKITATPSGKHPVKTVVSVFFFSTLSLFTTSLVGKGKQLFAKNNQSYCLIS